MTAEMLRKWNILMFFASVMDRLFSLFYLCHVLYIYIYTNPCSDYIRSDITCEYAVRYITLNTHVSKRNIILCPCLKINMWLKWNCNLSSAMIQSKIKVYYNGKLGWRRWFKYCYIGTCFVINCVDVEHTRESFVYDTHIFIIPASSK